MSSNKVVITVAVTGSIGDKTLHPQLPVTPKEIAQSALEAARAGASVAHIHVRDPATAAPSMELELYAEVFHRIKDSSDMLVNLTTGIGGRIAPDGGEPVGLGPESSWHSPEKRVEHVLALKPDLCSLDLGSLNFGPWIFANLVSHVEVMAQKIKEAGVKPELEAFELGHVEIGKHLLKRGLVESPPLFQLCLGISWGSPASCESMLALRNCLPFPAVWAGFGVGAACFPMVAQSVLLGGHVRVGFEDNFYLEKGRQAQTNAQLVEKAVRIIRELGKEPATPSEARKILHLE